MLRAVLVRKNRVSKIILGVRSLPPREQTNESMCFCYILAFGAIEYMLESLIKGWIQHSIRHHRHPYPGKPKVDYVITVLNDMAEFNLEHNNGIKFGKICDLVDRLTGSTRRTSLESGVDAYPGGRAALGAAIKRIETTRHNVAHGQLLPAEVSPNLAELENDFNHIYNCLVTNLDAALPRR